MKRFNCYLILSLMVLAGCSGSTKTPDLTESETRMYTNKGKEIVKATSALLSEQLTQALARGGVAEAVTYCNVRAYPMVDSLSRVHHALIKRATIWIRNPQDKADPHEAAILKEYLALKSEKKPLNPILRQKEKGEIQFYMPISVTTPLCLNCHGNEGTDMTATDYDIIRNLYPNDHAVGHIMGDLRGIWSITFLPQ